MSRRAALCVPASEPGKIAKALALPVDEVVVDLEDAVAVDDKPAARVNVADLAARASGSIAVRVNAIGTPWFDDDVAACVASPHVDTIIVPKAEDAQAIIDLGLKLDWLESAAMRPRPLGFQALIESPRGLQQAQAIAGASKRVVALIIGYADLSASMGRRIGASWQHAQDLVLLAARLADIDAIDGPLLTIAADESLTRSATEAESLGFDGKWVIHPAQIDAVQRAFTPSDDDIATARDILEALERAAADGRGAIQWRGQMLDEAVAVRARRTIDRAGRS